MPIPAHTLLAARALSGEFDPLSISGCQLWLDGDDDATFTFSTGTRVSQWDDKSGNNRNYTEYIGAWRPDRDVTVNGRSALRTTTDGDRTRLSYIGAVVTDQTAWTIFGVVRLTDASGGQSYFGLANNHGFFAPSLYATGGKIGGVYPGVAWWDTATAAVDETWYVHTTKRGGGTSTAYLDGSSIGTDTSTPGSTTGTSWLWSHDGGATSVRHEIAEIIVYDTALSDVNREAVEGYLAGKWGTA